MAVAGAAMLCVMILLSLTTWLTCMFSHSHQHNPGTPIHPLKFAVALLLPIFMAYKGVTSKKLNATGAFAALLIGWVTCFINYTFFIAFLSFYLLGSKATKFRIEEKSHERNALKASVRTWEQVVCNSFVATQLALFYYLEVGCSEKLIDFAEYYNPSWWSIGVLSATACCCGDTLASELGPVLPFSQPYLLLLGREVPKGTNGGMSVSGTLASAFGGFLVGLVYYISLVLLVRPLSLAHTVSTQWPVIVVCTLAGLIGSFIDSLLGSTLQYSGMARDGCIVERPGPGVTYISGSPILDNHSVNFFSSFLTSLIMPTLAVVIYYGPSQGEL